MRQVQKTDLPGARALKRPFQSYPGIQAAYNTLCRSGHSHYSPLLSTVNTQDCALSLTPGQPGVNASGNFSLPFSVGELGNRFRSLCWGTLKCALGDLPEIPQWVKLWLLEPAALQDNTRTVSGSSLLCFGSLPTVRSVPQNSFPSVCMCPYSRGAGGGERANNPRHHSSGSIHCSF